MKRDLVDELYKTAYKRYREKYPNKNLEGVSLVEIRLDDGVFTIGEYSIAGNYDDGYTVWRTGEDSDTLYDNISFERCVVWCLNS